MSNVRAVYPGTFDPVHNGHLNLMARASKLFDELIVAVFDHGKPIKSVTFTAEERVAMIRANVTQIPNIKVVSYGGLTVDFAQSVEAQVIVRGLRVFSDFEAEFRMALANQRLNPHIDVITLMAREENTFLSGTTVREIARFGGDISSMVPANSEKALTERFGTP